VDNAALLYFARQAQRFLEQMPTLVSGQSGPHIIIAVLAAGIRTASEDPVAAKILRDEGDWMGRVVTRRLDSFLDQGVEIAGPFLSAAMDAGLVRRQDPDLLAHWLLRLALSALVSPPPGDLTRALSSLLVPTLDPEQGQGRTSKVKR
jgi:hypothetical protein